MSITKQDLQNLSNLSYLNCNEKDHHLSDAVNVILKFMEQLKKINTQDIAPLYYPIETHTAHWRQDKVEENNQVTNLEKIAPSFSDNLYLVPKVIEEN